jgi:hypothetical protein
MAAHSDDARPHQTTSLHGAESVRHGVAVDVSVRDRNGATLHASGGS